MNWPAFSGRLGTAWRRWMTGDAWHRWAAGLALLSACASYRFERQRQPDGSWQFTCRLPMDACVREIENTCKDKRYRILRGESEMRRRDAPPFETEYRTSYLTVVCGDEASEAPSAPPNVAADAGARVATVCTPGATQACVGPGACAGGQACRADGTGYGPCDCGPQKAPAAEAGAGSAPATGPTRAPSPDAGVSDAGRAGS